MSDLAITQRCLDDDLAALPLEVATRVITAFEERRGLDPQSGETMSRVGGPLHKLHADLSGGRSVRAVTWYDQARDVCWLLAAGWHEGFYERVEELASTHAHLPTPTDVANFEADAAIRAMERVVRSARAALEAAIASPGSEVPVTTSPPPEAYFRVDGDVLWVRVTIFDRGRRVLTPKQVAAIEAAVFGKDSALVDYPPESGIWHSVLMMGPVPSLDSWPPPRVVQGAA